MFAVIKWEFEGQVGVVPECWLEHYHGVEGAWYPNRKVLENTKNQSLPIKGYRHYAAKKYRSNIPTYEEAEKIAAYFVQVSDSEKELNMNRDANLNTTIENAVKALAECGNIGIFASTDDSAPTFETLDLTTASSDLEFLATGSLSQADVQVTLNQANKENLPIVQLEKNGNKEIAAVQERWNPVLPSTSTENPTMSAQTDEPVSVLQKNQEVLQAIPTVSQRKDEPNAVFQKSSLVSHVSNDMIYRKLLALESEVKAVQNNLLRFTAMINDGEQDNTPSIPRNLASLEDFQRHEDNLTIAAYQKKMHKFLLPFARDGLCGRSIYAILGYLGDSTLWCKFSLRGQREAKRRFDDTRLYSALRRFCSSVNFRYKEMDDAISNFLKKYQRNKPMKRMLAEKDPSTD